MDALMIDMSPKQPATNWDAVFAEVNAWRGACVHHFSAVEVAVTETLLSLSEIGPGGTAIRLRHLIGQRLEDMTAAVAPDGPFHDAGKAAHGDLVHYREKHETFRNLLCHGFTKISVERNGHWVLVMRVLAIRSGKAERNTLVLDQSDALAKLEALRRDGGRLASALGQLRKLAEG
jgi:hypothetical protein